jgi:hypothetical protein
MAKTGPKVKPVTASRYNLYEKRVRIPNAGPFKDTSANYLAVARGNAQGNTQANAQAISDNSDDEDSNDSLNPTENTRRSWTREQKLGAFHYATRTWVPCTSCYALRSQP